MAKTQLEQFTSDPEAMRLYQQERLVVAVTELICKAMKERGLKRADLAKLLKKSRGRISQYLDGEGNLTIRTIADIFTVLGLTMRVCSGKFSICDDEGAWMPLNISSHWESMLNTWPSGGYTASVFDNNEMAA